MFSAREQYDPIYIWQKFGYYMNRLGGGGVAKEVRTGGDY